MAMDMITRAWVKKQINGWQSGLDHADVDNVNKTITFYWKAGGSSTMTFDQPTGFKSLEIRLIDGENHLIAILDDDTEVDAGVIPTPAHTFYEQTIATASATWAIQHNLNEEWQKLDIKLFDDENNILISDIDIDNSTKNLLIITFEIPTKGKAIIKK